MHVVDLAQGLGLLPVSDELSDRISIVDGDRMGFWLLPVTGFYVAPPAG